MRTSTRKMLGCALVASSLATPVLLCWFGAYQGPLVESHTFSIETATATTQVYESRWPLWLTVVLIGLVICGVIMILFPKRETTNG